MKKRTLMLGLMILLLGLMVGSVSAQGGNCFGDISKYYVCHQEGNAVQVIVLVDGKGEDLGSFPGDALVYGAANLSDPVLLTSIGNQYGTAELYFTGKQPVPNEPSMETTWTVVIYDASGVVLGHESFVRHIVPGPTTFQPGAMAMPVAPASDDGAPSAAPVAVDSVSGEYEPVIVSSGTVAECLVRATYTVRLREIPTTTGAIVDSVPYDTAMPSDLITASGSWSHVYYVGEGGVGKLGWISTDFLELSEACEDISVAADVGTVPVIVPASAAPVADEEDGEEAAPVAVDPTYDGMVDLTVVQPGTVVNCLVRTNYTVRIRVAPVDSAPVMDSVPYRTSMPADLRTIDDGWIRANYLGVLGWISADYLSLSDACEGLNGIAPVG